MSSPLPGADYLRPPVKCGTREEVLARMKETIRGFLTNPTEPVSREVRMAENIKRREEAAVWLINRRASLHPRYEITGPRLPSSATERVWYGRYGHVRQD